jgi:transposase
VNIQLKIMGKNKDMSNYQIGKIEGLLMSEKFKNKEIAAMLGVSESVVSRLKKKLKLNLPMVTNSRQKCGRKAKTTKREDRIIAKTALNHRSRTFPWIRSHLMTTYSICLSTKTIRSRLKKQGIILRNKTKKFVLNKKMMKKRRQWAWGMRHWGESQFSRVRY